MKKQLITASLLFMTALSAFSQTESAEAGQPVQQGQPVAMPQLRFGYLSCDSALRAMPDYAIAMQNLKDLRSKYDAEMKRVEDEFNQKYELFLEQQATFAPSIRQKRQAELQELMEKNAAFKKEAQRLLSEAETEALAPLKRTLQAAITRIGQQQGLAFVLNTDGHALPYADTTTGVDITQDVIKATR